MSRYYCRNIYPDAEVQCINFICIDLLFLPNCDRAAQKSLAPYRSNLLQSRGGNGNLVGEYSILFSPQYNNCAANKKRCEIHFGGNNGCDVFSGYRSYSWHRAITTLHSRISRQNRSDNRSDHFRATGRGRKRRQGRRRDVGCSVSIPSGDIRPSVAYFVPP
jgi:hypothetical protein